MSLVVKKEGTLGKRRFPALTITRSSRPKMTLFKTPYMSNVGMPKERTLTMRYTSSLDLTGTDGAFVTQVVSANSIFDPDTTGVGHQALGYDQWAVFYSQYVVAKARISVHFVSHSGMTTPGVVGVNLSSSSSAVGSTWDAQIEQARGSYTIMGPSAATEPRKLWGRMDAKQFFNVKNVRDKDAIGSPFGGSPALRNYFIIWFQSYDKATTGGSFMVYSIDYDVVLAEPKQIAQS